MADTCYGCQKENPGDPETIEFVYACLKFRVFKSGLECEKCTADKVRQRFDRCAAGVIKAEDGVPVVDWGQYKQFGERSLSERQKEICLILENLGVLSTSSKGNWYIVSIYQVQMSPAAGLGLLSSFFFTRRKDAVAYARVVAASTQYDWEIRHVDEVIPKEVALKERVGAPTTGVRRD